jgi:hypothetical protein
VISFIFAETNEIYVSLSGKGSNRGTIESPVRSLEQARDLIRKIDADTRQGLESIRVNVRGGQYQRTQGFKLAEQDSGTQDCPVIYRAYPGEEVIFHGAEVLPRSWFKKVKNKKILDRLINEDARTDLFVLDLKEHNISDYGVLLRRGFAVGGPPAPMELYYNEDKLTLARWPNKGNVEDLKLRKACVRMSQVVEKGSISRNDDKEKVLGIFAYDFDRPEQWEHSDDIWVDGVLSKDWAWTYNKIAKINTDKKTIKLAGSVP